MAPDPRSSADSHLGRGSVRSRALSSNSERPRLLDLYCCQGGAGEGFRRVGFEVVGVDIQPQPRNPGRVVVGDAIAVLRKYGHLFHAAHASPPCQHDSETWQLRGNEHPDLIGPTRDALLELGIPYVIENVRGAVPKLRDPIMLCGTMFGLEMYRHRYFETNWPLEQPVHGPHLWPQVKMGRAPKPGEFIQAVGNFSGVQQAREVMEMPWANRDGLREAIPPAYTRWVGARLLDHINVDRLELAA